ncbi:BNR-4 repeat-containing protein [Synoicihabitans lomoniglobus]|uniref:BNR-4 repeat-containing protein n=1 Tax=Synoicihabitans lomoniglobus TaxID=2909285 RepID=A0AAF0CQX4_9BACT|nr:BNR repeat-containing protein [Opitutaceae bacterium LMO-M01]WED66416.1 BNR-4 repeat-containing protein [Opitutaceae bacterium LMO-M01]
MIKHFRNFPHEISFWARIGWGGLMLLCAGARLGWAADLEVLSAAGSGRATAYVESPKIISFGDRTHVAWLDSSADGFRVQIRTLDQVTGQWGDKVTLGPAEDNHGGPALTIDAAGYLHVLYYSHHHPFRYRRSVRPNDASEWTPNEEFGHNLTYPGLVCAADGSLIMVARRSYEDRPWELELWRKSPGEAWSRQGPVLRSRHTDYAQFAASLAWSPDHKTLHLGARILELPTGELSLMHAGVVHLTSTDDGLTWSNAAGTTLREAATIDTAQPLATGSTDQSRILHVGSIDVGPAGEVAIPYNVRVQETSQSWIAIKSPAQTTWRHHALNRFLPHGWRDAALLMHGGVAYGNTGRLVVTGVVMRMAPDSTAWGEPSTEVVRFVSVDGGETFTSRIVGEVDPDVPHWMPNIERRTGFNKVGVEPALIYTAGERGDALKDQLSNRVLWVPGVGN